MPFQYDVFLSYSSSDREWAQRLNDSLKKLDPPQTTFFDQQSLRAGDDWEAKVQTALENSRHLVILWSDNARQSDWVTRELWTFFTNAKPKTNADRRLICVNLQGMNQATKTHQQIGPAEIQKAYREGTVPSHDAWVSVLNDIQDGLDPTRRAMSVPLVVLTVTRDELSTLSPDAVHRLEQDFDNPRDNLLSAYDADKHNWRPFGGDVSITELLDHLRTRVNETLSPYRVFWSRPDQTFWSDIQAAKKFVTNEFDTGELSVLVIDPVALYHPDVYQRLMLFQECMANNRRVILTLPPFGTPHSIRRLRDALVNRAMPYFDDYFQPSIPPKRMLAAHCGWNVSDTEDIRRLLIAAVGQLVSEGMAPGRSTSSAFIRHGAIP